MRDVKKLSGDHWDYIKETLKVTGPEIDKLYTFEEILDIVGYHYRTALEHGYGHGHEDGINIRYEDAPAMGKIARAVKISIGDDLICIRLDK